MKVSKKEVKVYEYELICDCGGSMKSTGMVYTVNPPITEYRCISCGEIVDLSEYEYQELIDNL